jgi:hypothetical protein
MLWVLPVLALCACGKEPDEPAPPAERAEAPGPVPAGATEPAEDRVELALELPVPQFVGTPRNIPTERLDPMVGRRKRAPFLAPRGTLLLSAGKPVTSSEPEPVIGELDMVVDGDKEAHRGGYVELGPGRQFVQIDLGEVHLIDVVLVWHYHAQARVYRDVIVQVGADADMLTGVVTIFNNDHDSSSGLGVGQDYEYIDTHEGRLLAADGVPGRYVRLYSNGSTAGPMNHYTEVEVYGRPAEG